MTIIIRYPAYEPDMTVYRDMHVAEKNVIKIHSPKKPHGNKYTPHQGKQECALPPC